MVQDEGHDPNEWRLGEKRWREMSPRQQARLSRMLGPISMDAVYCYLGRTTGNEFTTMLNRLDSGRS